MILLLRSAPQGRQQMGETGFCKNLRFPAVSCEILWFPVVFWANLRLPNPLIYRASRKSAKICENLRKCAFRVRFLPFAVSLLARPDLFFQEIIWTKGVEKRMKKCPPAGAGTKIYPPFLNYYVINSEQFNSVQTRCIVKGEVQKSPLFWRFSGGF